MYDGILNVYKEAGFTSFDVVAKLRGILHQKKIGHTGTLDPQAEGVLVVCVGKATKLCDILPDHDKEYEATLLLGVTTDTEDTTGRILEQQPVEVTEAEVRAAILSFQGTYEQIPPMYSAIKINGRKLYELARQGEVVERQPRTVTIYDLEIMRIQLPKVVFRIKCSRGTYIRSLCRDIGARLGCGGCMEKLVRRSACGFRVEDSLRLSEIERLMEQAELPPQLHSIDSVFSGYPEIRMKPEGDRLLSNGNKFTKRHIGTMTEGCYEEGGAEEPYFLVYDSKGEFKGIYEYRLNGQEFVPYKMFL